MNTTGLIFALLATFSWSLCIFPFTQAARRLGSVPLNHFRLLLAVILLGVASLLIDYTGFKELFQREMMGAWFWLGLSGIIGLTIGDHFGFAMYAILGPRIGSVLTTFAPAASLITGFFILDERLSFIGIMGMLITVLGVIWISLNPNERDKIPDHGHGSIRAGIIYGLLAAACQGAGLVLAKKGMMDQSGTELNIHPVHATLMRMFIATSSLYMYTIIRGKFREVSTSILENRNKGLFYASAGTLFGPVTGVSLALFTVVYLKASVAQTIFSLVPVFALLIAMIFFREKISLRALLGVFVAITGVLILIWREELKSIF
jgi:drug/metabolite transporter (DMT)-like permease